MAIAEGSWRWRALPSMAAPPLIYVGFGLAGLMAGLTVGVVAAILVVRYAYAFHAIVPILLTAVCGFMLLAWLSSRFVIWLLRRRNWFGVVRIDAGCLTAGSTSIDLSRPFRADARSRGGHKSDDFIDPKRPARKIRSRRAWVWTAALHVEQDGRWLTLIAYTRESKRQAAKQERASEENAWDGLETSSRAPRDFLGRTLRLASDDLAAVIRILQGSPHYRSIDVDDPSSGAPPVRVPAGLQAAIFCLAVEFMVTVAGFSAITTRLMDRLRREGEAEREAAVGAIRAQWEKQVGRSVEVDARGGRAFGEIVRVEVDGYWAKPIVRLVYVEDDQGRVESKVNIGGRNENVGEGDEVKVSPSYITFVDAADVPKRKPTLGGLSEAGDAEFRRILGDRVGKPLTDAEKAEVRDAFRAWAVANPGPHQLSDLEALEKLLAE